MTSLRRPWNAKGQPLATPAKREVPVVTDLHAFSPQENNIRSLYVCDLVLFSTFVFYAWPDYVETDYYAIGEESERSIAIINIESRFSSFASNPPASATAIGINIAKEIRNANWRRLKSYFSRGRANLAPALLFSQRWEVQIIGLSSVRRIKCILSLLKGAENENIDLIPQIREHVKGLSRYILTATARRGGD